MRVLDLASGAGEPALSLPDLVGSEGLAVATDIIPDMLSGLRNRAGARGLTYAAADMQALPFRSSAFDRVTCRFGLMFVPDPELGLREVARVIRPGGRAAFMVWGPREDQTLFTVLAEAVERVLGLPPDDHHYQIFKFGAVDSLSPLFARAGFEAVQERSLRFTPKAPLDKPFWRPQLAMSFGHVLHQANPDALAAIDREITALLAPLRSDEGYRLSAHIRIASGES